MTTWSDLEDVREERCVGDARYCFGVFEPRMGLGVPTVVDLASEACKHGAADRQGSYTSTAPLGSESRARDLNRAFVFGSRPIGVGGLNLRGDESEHASAQKHIGTHDQSDML